MNARFCILRASSVQDTSLEQCPLLCLFIDTVVTGDGRHSWTAGAINLAAQDMATTQLETMLIR